MKTLVAKQLLGHDRKWLVIDAEITYRLWSLGLGPGDEFEVAAIGGEMILLVNAERINIPNDLARKVSVERGL